MNGATVTQLVPRPGLTPSAARQLTDALKRDADSMFERLLSAYDQGVHTALGYPSWAAYCKAEFDMSKARAYQLIEAGRVTRAIKSQSKNLDSPKTDAVARRLTPVLKKGDEAVAEAWARAVERHGSEPTAEQVEEVVRAMEGHHEEPEPESEPEPPIAAQASSSLTQEQDQFARALRHIQTQCEYVSAVLAARKTEEKLRVRRVLDIDEATREEWNVSIKAIDNAARQLRRRVTNRRLP